MTTKGPARVRVRMYQVGFGDCILLTLEYDAPLADGRDKRHLLFDFGSSRQPHGTKSGAMGRVAELIEEHTEGKLDLVVVTHRHKDHLSGYGDDAAAKIMRKLAPSLVLRSWTEDPAISETADGPNQVGPASARLVAQLAESQDAAQRLALQPTLDSAVQEAAFDQVRNADAISLLDELAADGRGRYLYAGADADLGDVIPGLKITVLGPPTVEEDPRVMNQTEADPEYWMDALRDSLQAAAPMDPAAAGVTPDVPPLPGPARWLIERLADQKTSSVTRLVRKLDDALNNTSLLLLLEIGKLRLLFPGDAQIENWEYTLEKLLEDAELKEALAGIDLYKVGHHGSRNATPRSLHALWVGRSDELPRLTSIMSTLSHVHGESEATAVPRETLVEALRQVSTLVSTEDLDKDKAFAELEAPTTGGPFVPVP